LAPCHLYEGHLIIHDHTPLDKGMPHVDSVGLKNMLFPREQASKHEMIMLIQNWISSASCYLSYFF